MNRPVNPRSAISQVVISLVTSAILSVNGHAQEPKYLGVKPQRDRIDAMRAKLRSETFDQSIEQLLNDQQYFYPSFHSAQKGAQVDLEVMLSNRRSIKVIDDLGGLEGDKLDDKCKQLFDSMFKKHSDTILGYIDDPKKVPFKYSLRATGYGMAIPMFAAAENGRTHVLLEQVQRLLDFDARERAALANRVGLRGPAPADILLGTPRPDYRFMFNVLMLDVVSLSRRGTKIDLDDKFLSLPRDRKRSIVHWDAHTTEFDVSYRMEGIPLDISKGVKTYEFFDFPSERLCDHEWGRKLVQELQTTIAKAIAQ